MVPGPDSYTGEDMAELHTHGSNVIDAIHKVLNNTKNVELPNLESLLN